MSVWVSGPGVKNAEGSRSCLYPGSLLTGPAIVITGPPAEGPRLAGNRVSRKRRRSSRQDLRVSSRDGKKIFDWANYQVRSSAPSSIVNCDPQYRD